MGANKCEGSSAEQSETVLQICQKEMNHICGCSLNTPPRHIHCVMHKPE